MLAKELISKNMPVVNLHDKVYSVLNMMENFGVSHLPIVHDGDYVGLVSENLLFQVSDPNQEISDCAYLDSHVSVFDTQHIYDVLKLVADNKLSIIAVVTGDRKFIGSIISFDLLPSLNKLLCTACPGTLITLELNVIDYSLSQISQIVEYNNSKILSLYTNRIEGSRKMELTIKLESDSIISILESLNRYEYVVKAVYASDMPQSDVYGDRYENLMNFLNI